MEFISSEEFLKQPKEVQEVFIKWWKPSIGDLFCDNSVELKCILGSNIAEWLNTDKVYKKYFPLFTEGQLRRFIENKTGFHLEMSSDLETGIYIADFYKNNKTNRFGRKMIRTQETDLLQAYWKVALEMAKESVNND